MDIEKLKELIKVNDELSILTKENYNGKYKGLLLNCIKIINDIIKEEYLNVLKP